MLDILDNDNGRSFLLKSGILELCAETQPRLHLDVEVKTVSPFVTLDEGQEGGGGDGGYDSLQGGGGGYVSPDPGQLRKLGTR